MTRWTAVFALAVFAARASATPPLYWKSARPRAADSQTGLTSRIKSRTPGRAHSVLQFETPLSAAARRQMVLQGIRIVGYLPENGYVVSLPEGVPSAALSAHTAYPIDPGDKISPAIGKAAAGSFLVVFHSDVPAAEARAILYENRIAREECELPSRPDPDHRCPGRGESGCEL
ncbi:MAG: hypothetical protein NTY38_13585 [Acidobacteria bacterium]|nr:hypothetical protein [Acidobacteriota bacterium]